MLPEFGNRRLTILLCTLGGFLLVNAIAVVQIRLVLGMSLHPYLLVIPSLVGASVGCLVGYVFARIGDFDAQQNEAAAQLRAVVETAVDGIITIDKHGKIETVNPATAAMFGYATEEMVGQNVSMLMPAPYHAEHDGYLFNYRTTGQRKIIGIGREVEGQRKDGTIFPLELAVSETNVNNHRFFTGIVRDITQRRLAQETIREGEKAIDAERNRIARDLHDSVTQTLFSASMIADVLPAMWETQPEAARERLQELRELSRGAMAEMRTLLLELRPSALVDAELDQLLQQLADATLGRYRIPVHVSITGEINPLPLEWRTAIYRIVQEALNNAGKHAEATHVTVDIHGRPQGFNLMIQDDGCGYDQNAVKGGHFGLGIMQERAEAIEATLEIESLLDMGTTIWVKR